jgi:glycosyltransferase involved in cell wall biosynthesis
LRNILYISPLSYIGGGEVSLLTILRHLDKKRFNPSLICYSDGPFIEEVKNQGIEVTVFRKSSFSSDIAVILNILRYIRVKNIQLVHVNSLDIRGGIAAWLAGIPFIGHLRVIFPFTWRDRLFVRLSKKVVAVSNAVVDVFSGERGILRERFIVVPNAVEIPEGLTAAQLRKDFRIPEDAKLIGAVGRIDPCKGYEYFINAASFINKQRKDVYFFIIGGVSDEDIEGKRYLERLKRQVCETGLEEVVFFAGFRKDILEAIKALDILIVPSVVIKKEGGEITEGFGRVAIEAMAVGVPVVASRIGGLREIIEDGISGILVTPGEPQEIAKSVLRILDDEREADSLKKNARKRFERLYTPERCIESLNAIYNDILKRNG